MIKLTRIIGHNFMSFKSFDIDLDDRGLVSIEGDNQDANGADSNGSGKSTLINAVLWNSFGVPGKQKISSDSVVNNVVGRDCSVQSYWTEEDRTHRITRYRKHRSFKNAITVEQKIGFGEWKDVTKGTSAQIQQQIETILGCDLLTFQASCFVVQKAALDIPAMTDKELKDLLERTLPFEDLTDLHNDAKDNLNNQRAKINTLENKANNLLNKIDIYKAEGKSNLADKQEFDNKVAREITSLTAEAAKIEEVLKQHNDKLPGDLSKLDAQIKTLTEASLRYDSKEFYNAQSEFLEAARAAKELEKRLHHADEYVNCDTCGQETTDRAAFVAATEKALKEAKLKVETTRKVYQVQDKLHLKQAVIEEELENLRTKRVQSTRILTVIEAAKQELKHVRERIAAERHNPYLNVIAGLRKGLLEALSEEKALRDQITLEAAKLPVLEAVEHLYSPKGVRFHILEEITPILNHKTNYYLKFLSDGAISATWSTVSKLSSGEYREKFSIAVKFGRTTEYGALSGGEQRKVQLACFLALQDLVASRATKRINIWCCDEIDHALDGSGLERLISLLNEKTKTKPTILVISHNDLKEHIPNTATVIRKDDISEITGYLNGKKT